VKARTNCVRLARASFLTRRNLRNTYQNKNTCSYQTHRNSHKKEKITKTTQTTMAGGKRPELSMELPVIASSGSIKRAAKRHKENEMPATVVEMTNSSQSQMSSIGIGEFGMNDTSQRGNTTTFAMAGC